MNVNEGEGVELSELYKVGVTYPVFILTDKDGSTINRWVGYTGGAQMLVNTLKRALSDLTTVDEKIARFKLEPTSSDALFLAGYFTGIGDNLEAVEYYRRSIGLDNGTGYDYTYKIFENIANAVWKDEIAFAEVIPAADAVLSSKRSNRKNIIDVARLMTRLASKAGRIDVLKKYLDAGIKISSTAQDKKTKDSHVDLTADYALYIDRDTARAVSIKKASLGSEWQENRDQFYMFAKWCLLRKINLEEAEKYVRKTIDLVYPGKYRSKVYGTLAEILEAADKFEQAKDALRLAIEQDGENEYFQKELERLQEKSN